MKKQIIRASEHSTYKLACQQSTENTLFEIADRLSAHYKAPVLTCSKDREGHMLIKTASFVGVIDIDESLALEIIPKIYDQDDTANIRNLFFMLNYSGQISIPDKSISNLKSSIGQFFELIIRMFADETLNKIQNSPYHEYVSVSKNRQYLKGKLLLSQHIKHNITLSNKFYTQKDDFTPDNQLNQIIKYVCKGLYRQTNDPENKRKLRHCLALLYEVEDKQIKLHHIDSLNINRLNKHFNNIILFARLFITNQTLQARSGRHTSWTILIDMNVLFEQFVAKAIENGLARNNSAYRLIAQGPQRRFVRNIDDNREVFMMKPDVSIVRDGRVELIGDTKYKILIGDDPKYGVSQIDLYQMFAYAHRYDISDIVLIYPESGGVKPHSLELPDEKIVHVRTIDLNRNLRHNITSIEDEAISLFGIKSRDSQQRYANKLS